MSDRGLYVCTLRSRCGGQARASSILEVEPREVPTAELYPAARQTVNTGESALFQVSLRVHLYTIPVIALLMFQCRYMTGIPTPVITWTREDGGQLPPNVEVLSGGVLRFECSLWGIMFATKETKF